MLEDNNNNTPEVSGFNVASLDSTTPCIEVGNINDCSNKNRIISDKDFFEAITNIVEKEGERVIFHHKDIVFITGGADMKRILAAKHVNFVSRSAEYVQTKLRANRPVFEADSSPDIIEP
jgi:CobQ-like glutamine amidotransferase family enzyme